MKPTKRLEILEESLKKKQQLFDRRLQTYFDFESRNANRDNTPI